MGCSINLYVERKVDNKWVAVKKDTKYNNDSLEWFYNSVNYHLYALLANIRNDENIKPICQPKGIPTDCSADVLDEIKSWEDDGFGFSYFAVEELLKVDLFQTVNISGYISQEDYDELNSKGTVPLWWDDDCYSGEVKASWKVFLIALVGDFFESLSSLLNIESDPSKIRIVFFFDN